MTIKEQEQNTTTWIACECEACTSETETKGFENHQGDGPSGFDFAHDTKWSC